MTSRALVTRLLGAALLGQVLAALSQGFVAWYAMYLWRDVRVVPPGEFIEWSMLAVYVASSVAAVAGFLWGARFGRRAAPSRADAP